MLSGVECVKDGIFDCLVVSFGMGTWYDWVVYGAPDMDFVGLFSKSGKFGRVESEACDGFSDESLVIEYRSDEMKLCETLLESVFRQVFGDKYPAERVGDYDEFLIVQIWEKFLEPYLPCGIKCILFGWHSRGKRFESIRESVCEPLFPV